MKQLLQSLARRFGYEIRPIAAPASHAAFSDPVVPDYDLLALRRFADRAAQFSASDQQSRAIGQLFLSGILREQAAVEASRIEIGNANTVQVGIWRKQSSAKDAPFMRMADPDCSWARQETIEPKRCKWRVALIGESVARGYLYDPDFTPASVLQQVLRSYLGAADIEIVDLAQLSVTMRPLKVLIGQALALSPDAIVVFAGNNWHMQLQDPDIPYVDSALRKHGVPGLKWYIDSKVRHAVHQLMEQVSTLVSASKVRLIWVVPESNLDDWRDPISTAPLLLKQGNREWRDLAAQAGLAFQQRDLDLAEKLALAMVQLDGGTNAVPLRILAECCRCKADLQATKRYLEMCRDAEGWNPAFAYTPRTSVTIQNALREGAAVRGQLLVDLPEIIGRYLEDRPPGRRLFLDYCHFTAEGIAVATAAIGASILKCLGGQAVSLDKLQSLAPSAPAEVEGKACLLSAIHNAHYYQGYELISYWCERAVRLWPQSAEIMQRFVDFQTRRGEILACKSAIELSGNQELLRLLRDGRKRLDLALIDAMVERLAAAGIDIRRGVSELRATEHVLGADPKELTDFYYSSAMIHPSKPGWTSKSFATNISSHSIYTSAFCETSRFIFFGQSGRPVGLTITYRVPDPGLAVGTIKISVNGHPLAQAPAAAAWQTFQLSVLSGCLTDGLNEIVITWPGEEECSEILLDRAADALLARRMPRFYRVFGEIHSLQAFDPWAAAAAAETRSANSTETLISSEAAVLVTAE